MLGVKKSSLSPGQEAHVGNDIGACSPFKEIHLMCLQDKVSASGYSQRLGEF